MAKTVKKKSRAITIIGLVLLVLFAALTVVGFVFHDQIFGPTAWVKGIFGPDPETGEIVKIGERTSSALLNTLLLFIPKIVGSIQVLFVTLLVLYVVCTIIGKVFKGTPRRLTIGKLANSIIKVVIWVTCVIAVLAVWGFNVGALIAGAGVLTLIVGLGMQSLIADVVAGIFLVCDGTLQVGDIVTIDGWRGTVQEIGIRNTTLINYSGDIRVANNSTIKIFVNQSREQSYPIVLISVAYEEDIEKIEKVLADNADRLKERLPRVIKGPEYLGVKELADSGVVLQFGAYCKEDDFFQVQRDINREIKILFDENNIRIPFPQVDVHFDKEDKK